MSSFIVCSFWSVFLLMHSILWAFGFDKSENASDFILQLKTDWYIQSSDKVKTGGEIVSQKQYTPAGWYKTTVPATVLSGLVRNGVYKDIFFAKNLETIPKEQFANTWWYRTEFSLKEYKNPACVRLIFEGINYRANIYVNGKKIADADSVFGAFRNFEFDITKFVEKDKNILAVEVIPPKPGDFTIGFVDWNPPAPDRNMGLFRPVKVRVSRAVSANNIFVQSKINTETLKEAVLTVSAVLTNHSGNTVLGSIKGDIEKVSFSQSFTLKPYESKEVRFTAEQFPALRFVNPRLWWPNNLGEPNLYSMTVTVKTGAQVSDIQTVNFGIREVTDYFTDNRYRGYKINGKKLLIRGGGWVDDLLLDEDEKKLEAQLQYVKHMNLNTIRLEGLWGSGQKLYELADKYGILIMAGWSCQWEWQNLLGKPNDNFGCVKTPEDMELVSRMFRDQVLWLRNHPSIFVWVLGSDMLPRPELEQKYLLIAKEIDPSRPLLMSCAAKTSTISGATGVKMNGPYDYVTPNYWYIDTRSGGAFGFNTETGPGPQPPPLESLKKMIPADSLWPINSMWNYHCARGQFNTLDRYLLAFNNRYGGSETVEEFAFKSQAQNYEAMRAMYEAFGANKPNTTGIIQWMLNAAWPKLFWQLYDYYLMPTGAFYGAKKGSQPITLVYHYGDNGIYIVNDLPKAGGILTASAKLFTLNSKEIFSSDVETSIGENQSKKLLDIPELKEDSPVYFLDLKLRRPDKTVLSENFYWLSVKKDSLNDRRTSWYYTPNTSFADFTALKNLPKTAIQTNYRFVKSGKDYILYVTLDNPTDKIVFFIELQVLKDKSQQSVLPVLWDDNYVSLLPSEVKVITARFPADALGGEKPVFQFSGWNVENK